MRFEFYRLPYCYEIARPLPDRAIRYGWCSRSGVGWAHHGTLRRAEANRLEWRHLHLDAPSPYAELPSVVTKTSRRRVCDLPSCAVVWLRPLLERPEVPLGLSVAVYRARLREAAEVAEVAWEENLLRHSFGTYHVVHHRNASLTAEIMGNSPGIVRAHYANTAAPEAAAAWWAVVPADTSASKMLPFVASTRQAG